VILPARLVGGSKQSPGVCGVDKPETDVAAFGVEECLVGCVEGAEREEIAELRESAGVSVSITQPEKKPLSFENGFFCYGCRLFELEVGDVD
jgi:hypothetical protein